MGMRGLGGELFRYLLASAAALGADAGLLWGLTEWGGVPYFVSAAIGFTAGLAVVYTLSVAWVFRRRSLAGQPLAELALFIGIGVVGLALNEAILAGLTETLGLHYMAAKAASVGVVFTWNFAARKLALFAAEAGRPAPDFREASLLPRAGGTVPT